MEAKKIPGFENYTITKTGQVYNGDKRLKTRFNSTGQPFISIRKDNEYRTFGIARLLLLTYKGKPKYESDVALYKDGNNHNLHIDNLEWCDRSIAYQTLFSKETRYSEKRLENLRRAVSKSVSSYRLGKEGMIKVKSYPSITSAALDLGVRPASVSRCVHNPEAKCRGLYFRKDDSKNE